jgi:hypothetical protein
MDKIRSMCYTLIKELQEAMQELTFGAVLPIDLGSIVDSMAWSAEFRRQNYSFIEHVANREQVGVGYRYLLERARRGVKRGVVAEEGQGQ